MRSDPYPRPILIQDPVWPTSGAVFAAPHCGRVYPRELLDSAQGHGGMAVLRSSEDAYVDWLIDSAPDHGAILVTTEVPRAYVDFNRADTELDPALIEGVPRTALNPRVASGLGVIPRVVANGRALYSGKMPLSAAKARLARFWHPYHNGLTRVLNTQRTRFGQAILFDVHSMPHDSLSGHDIRRVARPQIVLGDRFGASCAPDLMAAVEEVFVRQGLRVTRNTPFAGAYIAQRYGQPSAGLHTVQIEIDRGLYLDEMRVQPSGDFDAFRSVMRDIVAGLAELARQVPGSLAAE
jgi:N-formylglutamate amidohydrolase